jgi:MFS family permease
VYFIYTLAFTGMEFTLTFLAKDRFQYTPGQNALIFVFVGFIIALVQGGVVRRMAPRLGEKRIALFGLSLILPGLVAVGLATTEALLFLGLGVMSVGSALANPAMTGLVSLYTPATRQGEVLGVFRSLGSLARATGPILAAFIYWRFGSSWPYLAAALLIVPPLVLASTLPHPERASS